MLAVQHGGAAKLACIGIFRAITNGKPTPKFSREQRPFSLDQLERCWT